MRNLSVIELSAWLADASRRAPTLLDVREGWEVETAALAGITHIPMREIAARSAELDAAAPLVCICHHGARSAQVAAFLETRGFAEVYNLQGGVDAWAREVDASMKTY